MSDIPVKVEVKLPGEAIDKKTADLIEKGFGPAISESGSILGDFVGILGDRVRMWRYHNRINIAKGVQAKLSAEGISPDQIRALPMREISVIVEEISNVDEPELSDLWAGLIASAFAPDVEYTADRSFTSTLSQLTESDAITFSALIITSVLNKEINDLRLRKMPTIDDSEKMDQKKVFEIYKKFSENILEKVTPSVVFLNNHMRLLNKDDLIASADNLSRLGLVEYNNEGTPLQAMLDSSFGIRRDRDLDELAQSVSKIAQSLSKEKEVAKHQKNHPIIAEDGKLPHFNIRPTNWGSRFALACKISPPKHLLDHLSSQ